MARRRPRVAELMNEGDYGDLVESVYEMALDPESWPALVTRLSAAFGGSAGTLMQENVESGFGGSVVHGLPDEAPGLYFNYYAGRNILRRVPGLSEFMSHFSPTVTYDEEFMPKSELVRSEFYADFLRHMGIHSLLTLTLWSSGMDVTALDIYRPSNRPGYDADDLRAAQILHPHLVRAFGISRRLAGAALVKDGLADAINRAPYGFFILDADRRPRHANVAGERMLKGGGGLTLVGGRLAATLAADTARLDALIGAACGPVGTRAGGSIAVRRPGGRAPLSLTVAPAEADRFALFSLGPTAMVYVSDPEAAQNVSEIQLLEVFGLTPSQSKVAISIFEGRSARETAEALGLSFFTVRAHLAQIFEKTGVNRQVELVSLMTRMTST